MKSLKSNEEILICPICYVRYRNDIEMTPHCLKCGHTFCKKCLISMKKGNGIKCGICQIETLLTVDNPIVENKAILNTLSLINCLDYTYRSINKFSFYHCDTCEKSQLHPLVNFCTSFHILLKGIPLLSPYQ